MAECDDGNNNAGDGCSADCKAEAGFKCKGGSPTAPDVCTVFNPTAVTIQQTGQIRYSTSIVLNIKIDYLPLALLQSIDCRDRCSSVLIGKLSNGETSATVTSSYTSGTNYAFTMKLEFNRPFIAKFDVQISINPALAGYFGTVSIANSITVPVTPVFMAIVDSNKADILV